MIIFLDMVMRSYRFARTGQAEEWLLGFSALSPCVPFVTLYTPAAGDRSGEFLPATKRRTVAMAIDQSTPGASHPHGLTDTLTPGMRVEIGRASCRARA